MKNPTLSLLITFASLSSLHAQISLTGAGYSEDFESMDRSVGLHSWTDNSTLAGWYAETGYPTDPQYRASNGNNQSAESGTPPTALFLFRPGGTDGALGSLSNSTYQATFGAQFTNATGSTITELTISYTGEQWSWGSGSELNTLNFAYSTDAANLSTGAWSEVSSLSFTALYAEGTGAGLNGNSDTIYSGTSYVEKTAGQAGGPGAPNSIVITATISGLNIASGESFWIRWSDDFSGTGNGQGLAIDNLSVSAIPEPSTVALCLAALIGTVLRSKRRRG